MTILDASTSILRHSATKTTVMEISNPRRILAVSRHDSGLPELLQGNLTLIKLSSPF